MCHVGFVSFRFLNQRVVLQQAEGLKDIQGFYISFVTFITQSCNLLGERQQVSLKGSLPINSC